MEGRKAEHSIVVLEEVVYIHFKSTSFIVICNFIYKINEHQQYQLSIVKMLIMGQLRYKL